MKHVVELPSYVPQLCFFPSLDAGKPVLSLAIARSENIAPEIFGRGHPGGNFFACAFFERLSRLHWWQQLRLGVRDGAGRKRSG